MSTLKVNKIRDTAGSADAIVLDPSGGVKMSGICTATTFDGAATSLTQIPAANIVGVCTSGLTKTGGFGKILQVVQTVKTDTTSTTSQIPSVVDVSGMSVAITPSASSSKILISYHLNIGSNTNAIAFFRLNRKIASGSFSEIFVGSVTPATTGYYGTTVIYNNDAYMHQSTACFLDTPSYTLGDEVTYKLTYGSHNGNNITLNGYTGTTSYSTPSSITAQEIAT